MLQVCGSFENLTILFFTPNFDVYCKNIEDLSNSYDWVDRDFAID